MEIQEVSAADTQLTMMKETDRTTTKSGKDGAMEDLYTQSSMETLTEEKHDG